MSRDYNSYDHKKNDLFTENIELVEEPKNNNVIGKVVNCDFLNVRSSPNKDSKIVGYLSKDIETPIKSVLDGWYEIETGYVMADFIELQ